MAFHNVTVRYSQIANKKKSDYMIHNHQIGEKVNFITEASVLIWQL